MGERKVLNRYYPPDFDPSKLPKHEFNYSKPMGIRMMLPFSLCCESCGHFMYQGKKFNSKKETVKGMDYLGIKRYRFTIKCEICNNKICFLTDPKNQDYECESGATRNFSAWQEENKNLQDVLRKEEAEEILNGPKKDENKHPRHSGVDSLKGLEDKALESKREMNELEMLERVRELKRKRLKLDPEELLKTNYSENNENLEETKEKENEQDEAALREFSLKTVSSRWQGNNVAITKVPSSTTQDDSAFKAGYIVRKKSKRAEKKSSIPLVQYESSSESEN